MSIQVLTNFALFCALFWDLFLRVCNKRKIHFWPDAHLRHGARLRAGAQTGKYSSVYSLMFMKFLLLEFHRAP